MSVNTAEKTSLFGVLPPLAPVSSLPVPVAATPVEGIKRRLSAMTDEVARSGQGRTQLLAKTWEVVQHSPLQRKGGWAYRHDFEQQRTLVASSLLSAMVGGVVTAFAAASAIVPTAAYVGTCLAGASVCASAAGLFWYRANRNYQNALKEKAAAMTAMVELEAVQPLLDRFHTAAAAEKLAVGLSLEETFQALNANRQLAPESVAALEATIAEIAELERIDGGQARRERSLQRILTTDIQAGDSLLVADVLAKTSDAERPLLARALMDVVFANRDLVSRSAYEPRNELFKLLQSEMTKPASAAGPEKPAD